MKKFAFDYEGFLWRVFLTCGSLLTIAVTWIMLLGAYHITFGR